MGVHFQPDDLVNSLECNVLSMIKNHFFYGGGADCDFDVKTVGETKRQTDQPHTRT